MPEHYYTVDWPDIFRLIGIAWVFRKPTEFKDFTQIVEREEDHKFERNISEDLHIPKPIIGQSYLCNLTP
jgi:hypothetical protein